MIEVDMIVEQIEWLNRNVSPNADAEFVIKNVLAINPDAVIIVKSTVPVSYIKAI